MLLGYAELEEELLFYEYPMPVGTELIIKFTNNEERKVRVAQVIEDMDGTRPHMIVC